MQSIIFKTYKTIAIDVWIYKNVFSLTFHMYIIYIHMLL